MTTIAELGLRARVCSEFFDAYRRQDVDAMVSMCTDIAEYRQVPFEMWGRQRVLRADGHVGTIGKVLWTGMIRAFPDLSNTVRSIGGDDRGNVVVDVVLAGTQAGPWGVIGNRGARFELEQLVLFRVTEAGLIDGITSYWDNASLYRQLGHLEVD